MLFRYLFLLLGLFTTSSLFGQAVDSLEQLLSQPIDADQRIKVLSQLSEHYRNRNFDKTIDFATELLALSEKNNRKEYIAESYYFLGVAYNKKNASIDSVMTFFDKGLELYEEIGNDKGRAKILTMKGIAYSRTGNHDFSYKATIEALDLFRQVKDTLNVVYCLNNMARLHVLLNDEAKGIQFYREALGLAKPLNNTRVLAFITNNIGNAYFNTKQLDSAKVYFYESLRIKKQLGNELLLVSTMYNIAKTHVEEGDFEIADTYIKDAYAISNEANYPFGKGLSLSIFAKIAYKKKDYNKAIQYANQGLQAIGKEGDIELQTELYEILFPSYEENKQYEQALASNKRLVVLKDSVYQMEKEKEIRSLEIGYQVEKKELDNELLKANQEVIQERLDSRTYLVGALVVLLLVAIGWASSIFRSSQERKKTNSMLEEKIKARTVELRDANENLQQANYELRTFNYIASHDIKEPIRNIGNYIGLTFRKLPADLQVQFADNFDTIKDNTKRLYTLLEDINHYLMLSKEEEMKSQLVDLNQLVETIELSLHDQLKERNGRIINHGLPTIYSSPSFLYPIFRNLIDNGLKYNESPVPTVELRYNPNGQQHDISISDNGIGIDPGFRTEIFDMFKRLHHRAAYKGSGIGLAIVKLLVEKLKGSIRVDKDTNAGSQFIVSLVKQEGQDYSSVSSSSSENLTKSNT
ncbi:MAG: tetratricopeptide repeat protein [Bacteroidota bacterium]